LSRLFEEEFKKSQGEIEGILYLTDVGLCMYFMVDIWDDLAFGASQFMSTRDLTHWMTMKPMMRYLMNTLYLRLYLRGKNITLRGF